MVTFLLGESVRTGLVTVVTNQFACRMRHCDSSDTEELEISSLSVKKKKKKADFNLNLVKALQWYTSDFRFLFVANRKC